MVFSMHRTLKRKRWVCRKPSLSHHRARFCECFHPQPAHSFLNQPNVESDIAKEMAKQLQIPNEHRAILIRLGYDHVFFRRNKAENHEVGLWSWSQYQHLLFILARKTKPIVRESSVGPRSQSDSLAGELLYGSRCLSLPLHRDCLFRNDICRNSVTTSVVTPLL